VIRGDVGKKWTLLHRTFTVSARRALATSLAVAVSILAVSAAIAQSDAPDGESGVATAQPGTPSDLKLAEPAPLPMPTAPAARPDTSNYESGIPPNKFGHLGVTVVPIGKGDGLRVVGIEPTSPAYPAGLLIDDEITTINGQRITRFSELVAGLHAAAEGDGNISLLVRRRGTVDTINLFVGGKKAPPPPAKLGVTLDDTNGRLRVVGVEPKSPAAKAGLQLGDDIITVNDYPVSTFDLFVSQIQALGRAGGPVSIGIRRNGQPQTLHAMIGTEKNAPLPKSGP